jgi:hypothetical protein
LKEKPLSTQVYEIITFYRGLAALADAKAFGHSLRHSATVGAGSFIGDEDDLMPAQMTDLRRCWRNF